MTKSTRAAPALLGALLALAAFAPAQQHKELGRMWPFENVPAAFFDAEYGFQPTKEWLDQARLASLRYDDGCSASFVSPRGLILTNHHCARDNVAAVTPPGQDWLTSGWFAKSLDEEVKVPGLTVQQLVAMKDVTGAMRAGVEDGADEAAVTKTLEQNEAKLVDAAKAEDPNLTYQVVSFYQGGMYQLYSYKVYDDVRLVATPDIAAATFGGDPDNFTYPRYDLDFSFVRAWEDGKPADTSKHYFKVKTRGPKEGETVFVTGNPGSTGRLNTIAQMEFMRDIQYPFSLRNINGRLAQLRKQEQANKEKGETGVDLRGEILNLENAQKAFTGYLDGLKNEKVMAVKRKAEAEIRERVAANPELQAKYGDAWTRLEEINKRKTEIIQTGQGRGELRKLMAEEEAYARQVGDAFFAAYGTEIPPDATFTLRLSDGVIKGYPMNGTIAPFFTSLYGLYARYTEFGGKAPFNVDQRWLDKQKELDLTTPVNHVSTCDIIGGNSGSPMIDTDLNLVGLVFDGNIESLGNRFVFTDDVPRTVCVHPAFIVEALRKIYDANKLADEFEGKGKGY